jgi:spore coat protein JB
MDNQQSLLYNIMLFDFAVQDSSLFLDTHPKDKDAFAYYKEASQRLQLSKNAYEKTYGPLDNRTAIGNHYSYSNGPWPWEGNTSCGYMKNACNSL